MFGFGAFSSFTPVKSTAPAPAGCEHCLYIHGDKFPKTRCVCECHATASATPTPEVKSDDSADDDPYDQFY